MIKIEKTEVSGWEAAIRGMRNPMNSWNKSDSCWTVEIEDNGVTDHIVFRIGDNDHKLMMNLAKSGTDHSKYRRFINVTCDITAPLYWWKEFDTYKVGTVANSCSTMHKIHSKEFTLDDFSFEDCDQWTKDVVCSCTINALNMSRNKFISTGDKSAWRHMIQLLPSSYNQKRTVQLNYEVLSNMYQSRKNHKLTEWHVFCDWVKSLPYSELITLEEGA